MFCVFQSSLEIKSQLPSHLTLKCFHTPGNCFPSPEYGIWWALVSNWYYLKLSRRFQKGVKVALEGVSRSENRLSDSLCSKSLRASDLGFPPWEDTSWCFDPRIEWDPKSHLRYDLKMRSTVRVKQGPFKIIAFPDCTLMEGREGIYFWMRSNML